MHDVIERGLDLLDADRSLFQRPGQAPAELFLVERFAGAIAFHHPGHDQLRGLEGGEPLPAGLALAPAAHRISFRDQPGVYDLGVIGSAEGTVH